MEMTETDILESLDFDLEDDPCQTTRVPFCGAKAVWINVKRCCGYSTRVCDEHKREHEENNHAKLKKHPFLICRHCRTRVPDNPSIYIRIAP